MYTAGEHGGKIEPINSEPSHKEAWILVLLLIMTATLAFIDRQMFNLFAQAIKVDLDLSDTQLGTLQGLAFSLFYGTMSFPIARLADTYGRKKIIGFAVFFWSIATAATAFSRSFVIMFLCRMGTASGEAGLAPSASAMMADVFPRSKLALPISLYAFSIYLGSGIAFLLGGAIQAAFGGAEVAAIPVIGRIEVWRLAFLAAGFIGIPWVLFLMKVLREPARTAYSADGEIVAGSAGAATFKDLLGFLRQQWFFFFVFLSGFVLILGALNAVYSWSPTVLIRIYKTPISQVGAVFGLTFFSCGVGGSLFSGWVGSRKFVASIKGGLLIFSMACVFAVLAAQACAVMSKTMVGYLAFTGVSIFFLAPLTSLPIAVVQSFAPSNMRAQLVGLFLMVTGVMGIGIGPIVVGLITDYIFVDPKALNYAVALTTAVFSAAGLPLLLMAWARMPR